MRPYIITHMGTSLDGRIDVKHWGKTEGISEYERTGNLLKGDAWMVGRVTMEMHFASKKKPKFSSSRTKIDRSDFVADHKASSFAIAVDQRGKLFYDKAYIDDDHIITVLTEKVSNAYLHYLREKNISYIFGGKSEIDFKKVMQKLAKLFPIKRLLLEGGGGINGSVLAAGVVDEISILQFPVVDGTPETPALFDVTGKSKHPTAHLKLISVKKIKNDILWLRYRVS